MTQAVGRDRADAAGPAEGAAGPGGDVAGAGGDVEQPVQQPGAVAVGAGGVPVAEAAGGVGGRPGAQGPLHRRLDRGRHAPRLLDLGLLLSAGLPHRHAPELRAQECGPDRHGLVGL